MIQRKWWLCLITRLNAGEKRKPTERIMNRFKIQKFNPVKPLIQSLIQVRKGRQTRSVDQLLYTQWSERNIRSNLHSFLSFIKSAAASTQSLGGKVLICSRYKKLKVLIFSRYKKLKDLDLLTESDQQCMVVELRNF